MMSGRAQYRKVGYREKRKDRRVLFPNIAIFVEGASFDTTDWSFGGFRVEGSNVEFAVGDPISGTLGWDDVRFPFFGRVTRVGGDACELAVSFTDISDAAMTFLDRRLSDYLSSEKPARPAG